MGKRIRILAFGIAKDICNASYVELDVAGTISVKDIKNALEENFPPLRNLSCYRIAVNNEFTVDTDVVRSADEVAIIPPVSGG